MEGLNSLGLISFAVRKSFKEMIIVFGGLMELLEGSE